ncbi:OmpA family protein [Pedobacter sp. N23S346]|uniref:OmpA family protein n=1 Tax=Pedobacter sp. N23S346 TaxID=3402750 RepID=UPI003ACCED13
MAKGIKKIVWTGEGTVYNSKKGSIANQLLVVEPSQFVWFKVGEWLPGSTEQDKNKDVKWAVFNSKGFIEFQKTLPGSAKYALKIPRKLSGPYLFYIEATWSGNFDGKSGIKIRGESPAKIVDSKWSRTEGGEDVRKTYQFSYGELIWLKFNTEGLNGYNNVEVRVFRKLRSAYGLLPKEDEVTRKIYFVNVINGEINLKIPNTFAWYQSMKNRSDVEEFYVRVVHPKTGNYIQDDKGDTAHARFLRIKDKVVSQVVEKPQNRTPVTIYEPDKNAKRFELCKFEQINITEAGAKPVLIFDNGKGVRNIKDKREKTLISIVFKFDSTELLPESLKQLNNILQFLLEHRYSTIQLDGFACVIGKQNHNNVLSENRAKTVRGFFIKGKLDPNRIKTAGHGEVNPTDDKMGRDNIKYKNEYEYTSNRRVDISFEYYGHNAETINYQTILGSTPKNITIEPVKFDTKACFERKKHDKIITLYNLNEKKAQKEGSIIIPAVSAIGKYDLMPIQYIWPMNKATLTNVYSSANEYLVHVHSCRYFSVENNPTLNIQVYPDIKWTLTFFINLTNDLSVKWQNQPAAKHKELQSKAGKVGAERRWKQKDASFGFSLKGEWDKNNDSYQRSKELKAEYETKFKKLFDLFASVGAMSDGITNKTKGQVRNIGFKGLPMTFAVKPPNLNLKGEWNLEKTTQTDKIGTKVDISFNAEPLIGLEMTIDLLCTAVGLVAGAVSGGTAAPGAVRLYGFIKDKINTGIEFGNDDFGAKVTADVYIDLVISSVIKTNIGFSFNTASDKSDEESKLELTNTLKVELKAGIWAKAESNLIIVKVEGYFEMSGKGYASVTFGHGVKYDKMGLNYRPKLGFDGLNAEYVIKGKVGMSAKKKIPKAENKKPGELKGSSEDEGIIAEGKYNEVIPKFDVIKSLEELFGISANIPLIKS